MCEPNAWLPLKRWALWVLVFTVVYVDIVCVQFQQVAENRYSSYNFRQRTTLEREGTDIDWWDDIDENDDADNDRNDRKDIMTKIGRDDLNQEAQEEQNLDREMLSPKRIITLNT